MKKLLLALLCLTLLLSIPVHAAVFEPRQFLDLYGLIVTDEPDADGIGFSWCSLEGNGLHAVLTCCDSTSVYRAVDDPNMNDDTMDVSNISMTFLDFCGTFDFDAYFIDSESARLVYTKDTESLEKLFELRPDFMPDAFYHEKNDFVNALESALYEGVNFTSTEEINEDMSASAEITESLTESVNKLGRYDMLYGSRLNHLEVNPNLGTAESGDFIGLVYMIYDDFTSPKGDYEKIIHAATDIATMARGDCPEIVELCVFMDLPAYDAQAKIQFYINDGRVEYGDVMVPAIMVR